MNSFNAQRPMIKMNSARTVAAILATWLCVLEVYPVICLQQQFHGDKVMRIMPQREDQLQALYKLQQKLKLDFWTFPTLANHTLDVHVPAPSLHEFKLTLRREELDSKVLIHDIDKLILEEKKRNRQTRDTSFDLNSFHKLSEIQSFLKKTARENKNVTLEKLGTSYEGRYIYGMKISKTSAPKKIIVLECGMHAREWISPATCVWIINYFTSGAKISDKWWKLLKKFDIYLFPMMNPDGYHYSWTKNRFWRKSRSQTKDPKCHGVDGNRNWDVAWGKFGTSTKPCEANFGGEKAFSEKENIAMKNKIASIKSKIAIFISVHSYGQAILVPYGMSLDRPSDYEQLKELADSAASAMRKTHGKPYRYGQVSHIFGRTSGSSLDWAYKVAGVTNSFAFELRDVGQNGFVLPKSEIEPTAEEFLAGLTAIAEKTN